MGSLTTNGAGELLQFDNTGKLPVNLDIAGNTFTGSGAGLTDLPGASLTPGTVGLAALDATGTPSASTFLRGDDTWATAVTSVSLSVDPVLGTVSGSPITGSGTLNIAAPVMAAGTFIAGPASSSGVATARGIVPSDIDASLSGALDLAFGSAQGSLLQRTAAGWASLAPGMPGQALQSNGAGANLSWGGSTTPSGGNLLIGGDFSTNPWQRGTTFTGIATTNTYTADRWFGYAGTGAAMTVSQSTGIGLAGFTKAARVQRPGANTNTTAHRIAQIVESANTVPMQGQACSLSFYARAGADFSAAGSALSIIVQTGTGTDEGNAALVSGWTGAASPLSTTQALTTTWARYTFSVPVGGTATELAVIFGFTPTGTAATNDWFEVTGVQLEISPLASSFERRLIGQELTLCQRYFETNYGNGVVPGSAVAINSDTTEWVNPSSNFGATVHFSNRKRVTPALTLYDVAGNSGKVTYYTSGWNNNGTPSVTGSNVASFYVQANISSSGATAYMWTANAEL